MRPVRGKRIVAILAAGGLSLAAAACGDAPEETPSGTGASTAAAYKACMVTDTGGIDDKSFNASAWADLQAAKESQSNVEPKYVASTSEADYEPNLRQFVTQKCNFILSVGGLMGDATKKVATENTSQQFGIVDASIPDATNVFPMQFATEQAAFLAELPRRGLLQDGQGRHLRRPEDSAGHRLHGRLRRRRRALQQGQGQGRQGARLGQGQAERHLRRELR
nr:hypothetical protein GCM10020092_010650 [Actinoplanes digitatis]